MDSPKKMPSPPAMFPAYREPRLPWSLLGFAGLSLFGHAATFFIFQVIYPQRVTLPPPAPHVALLTPDTPDREALLRWVAAEDPALVAASTGANPPGLLELAYRPSFAALRTPPRTPAEEPPRVEPPPSPLQPSFGEATGAGALAVPGPVPTRVRLTGALSGRTLISSDGPTLRATAALQAAEYLLALNDRGEARFVFVQRSSGDETADAAGARWLASSTFSRASLPLAWGMATISWGTDAYAPAASALP